MIFLVGKNRIGKKEITILSFWGPRRGGGLQNQLRDGFWMRPP